MIPRTPCECTLPRPDVLRTIEEEGNGQGRFWQKVVGRCTQNPWISLLTAPKSLIVYKCGPTGYRPFYTCCASVSTCPVIFSTCLLFRLFGPVSIYLSLFKEEEERKEGWREKQVSTGFLNCLFFNPRVFFPIHPYSVDCVGPFLAEKSWR